MTLSDLAAIGSFVSGVAVLASLVFLFSQMRQITEQARQAERNQRALMQQGRANRITAGTLRATDPEMARLIVKAPANSESLEEVELRIWSAVVLADFQGWEDTFLQHRAGLFEGYCQVK